MRRKINRDNAVWMYTGGHLTCAEIGKVYGVSRVAVWKVLQLAGVKASQGERVQVECDHCGSSYELVRSRWRRNHRKHFCTEQCYWASLANPAYVESRQGQRMARLVAGKFFRLPPGAVVHHWDSDTRHNHPNNLAVFLSHSEHMSCERGGYDVPAWDGRKLTAAQLAAAGYSVERPAGLAD